MTSYTVNIPLASDDPSKSQDQILQNFQSLNTSNSINHEAYNDPDQGKHKFLQMPEQSAAPATAGDEGGLYTKQTVATIAGLFFRRESSGTELQLTDIDLTTTTVLGANQYTFLSPWGLRFTFGKTGAYTSETAITLSTDFTTIYTIQVSPNDGNATSTGVHAINTGSPSNFKVKLSSASISGMFYLVIGV